MLQQLSLHSSSLQTQLEEESGESSSSRHETFSGSSSIRNNVYREKTAPSTNYQPVIEDTHTRRETLSAAPTYVSTPSIPVVSTNQNEATNYVRSESIMDSFNQERTVDLNAINTGVEYNEGTTFTDTQGF